MANALGIKLVVVQGDSQLIIGQVNGTYEAMEERMKKYLNKVKHCIKGFTMAKFHQIPRKENTEANRLARVALADNLVDD